jgi:hypothetical protein
MTLRVPFGAALAPEVDARVAAMLRAAGPAAGVLGPDAIEGARAALARDLCSVLAPTLLEEFRRVPGRRWLDRGSTAAHEQFVARLVDGGLARILDRLPRLAEYVDVVAARWERRWMDALTRFATDAPRLGLHVPVARAEQLAETTIRLTDAAGRDLVYKNRRVALDRAWSELLAWLNGHGPALDVLTSPVVDLRTHGYSDFVAANVTDDADTARLRWQRAGMLMCLTHLLGGGDAHESNVSICGEHVVVIDAEKVLRPGLVADPSQEASVLSTIWLPTQYTYARCGVAAQAYSPRPQRWVNVGTDAVRQRPSGALLATIVPKVDRLFATSAAAMVAAMTAGFRDVYRIVSAHGLPLDLFEHTLPRVIVRGSALYIEALDALVRPENITDPDAVVRIASAAVSASPACVRHSPAIAAKVAAVERASLEALVIPRFSVWAVGDELLTGDENLGVVFAETPLDRAARFVAEMSDAVLEHQCDLIAATITAARDGLFAATPPRGFICGGDLAAAL